jgi:DNA polymerase-4
LACTVAISSNKLLSKVAPDEGKPDGYIRIAAGDERAFLAPLAVRKLPGAGPKTCETLESLGIQTIGQLAEIPQAMLERVVGNQTAVVLQRAACGIAHSQVEVGGLPKSISRETTFEEDLLDWAQVERVLTHLTERCAYAMREDGLETKRVTLKVRYRDFQTKTFARTLPESTCIDAEILAALRELLPKAKERRARVRLIGVNLSMLHHNHHQLRLFGGEDSAKWERAMESVDTMRGKFGFRSLSTAKALGARRSGPQTVSSPQQAPDTSFPRSIESEMNTHSPNKIRQNNAGDSISQYPKSAQVHGAISGVRQNNPMCVSGSR